MKKINIVKKNEDFNRIIQTCKSYKTKHFFIYLEEETNTLYHFGFSVGKKIGNAVTRNRIKRQMKQILSEKNYQNGFNCIIIVRKSVLESNYQELKKELLDLMTQLKLIKENVNEKTDKDV